MLKREERKVAKSACGDILMLRLSAQRTPYEAMAELNRRMSMQCNATIGKPHASANRQARVDGVGGRTTGGELRWECVQMEA